MKNQCRKRVNTQGRFDHDFQGKIELKRAKNRAKIDPTSMKMSPDMQ